MSAEREREPEEPVAVAFVIREKFSVSLASLRRLYALAGASFTLYFVDSRYPAQVRPAIDDFLRDKPNVVRLQAERFLYPNEALNLALGAAREERFFLLQNDVLIARNTLALLAESLELLDADVVVPEILDIETGQPARHRGADERVSFVERDGTIHGTTELPQQWTLGRRRVDFFEWHCLLARTEVLRSRAPFPPLSFHDHIDLCLDVWRARQAVYEDERARVLYVGSPPLRLRDFECPYFRFRWEPGRMRLSDSYVRGKWPLAELFDPAHFIAHQHQGLRPENVLERYDSAFAADTWPEEFQDA